MKSEDIDISPFKIEDIPQFQPVQVWTILTQLRTNKSTVEGDVPAKIYKEFAAYLAEPLAHVFNSSLLQGKYPNIYKYEISTPVPKKFPIHSVEQMRNISGLLNES